MEDHRIPVMLDNDVLVYVTPDYRIAVDQTDSLLWSRFDMLREQDAVVTTPGVYATSCFIFLLVGIAVGVLL